MTALRIHYLQHVPFEGLGYIETWAKQHKHKVTCTRFYQGTNLPKMPEFDWLIIMGGPMGVYEEAKYEWLSLEKNFIGQAIEKKKFVLGICLGAQLIAHVLGAKVYPNQHEEIGWFPITFTADAESYPPFAHLPEGLKVLHWHSDTFDLPQSAQLLASSQACRNQAFVYQEHVVGLQFHSEMTANGLLQLIHACQEELERKHYIQSANDMFREENFRQNHQLLTKLLNKIADGWRK
jgi:GMP synthase-like glutamine amidotransferase